MKFLHFESQLDLFTSRGMIVEDRDRAIEKIQSIGYYKIKGFAYALIQTDALKDTTQDNIFKGVRFNEVIERYYQDKNLRSHLMHAIEKIEVSVKIQIGYVLGKNYGAFGYTNFGKWTKIKVKKKRLEAEQEFNTDLKKKISRNTSPDFTKAENKNIKGHPSIWLAMDVLTFGDITYMLTLMSKQNINKIASYYNLNSDTFISWMRCLNFIRNLCAHNSNIIDIKLKTPPKMVDTFKSSLFQNTNEQYSNRIAIVILIIQKFINNINPKYRFNQIYLSLDKMINDSDKKANLLGFASFNAFSNVCPIKHRHRAKNNYNLSKK